MRQTGDRRQTSNLVEIQRAVEQPAATPCHTDVAHQESPSINPKNNNTKETAPATAGALKRSIYEPLYNALKPYFNDDDMYNVYGILLRAKASVDRDVRIEDHSDDYIDVLKAVVFAYKQGRVRSIYGCLYGAWNKVTAEISRRIKRANGVSDIPVYDWLAQ
ncbi:hypothetical protein [Bacillus sp. DNRA2]|uniref:hypothetical protein n=1 Tax=Bacillus sp. DNRA2 TaxID=2723053 RepID=UPI002006DDEB|nr:hypothetical protein [Bacillus sp. DNRA2]